MSVIEACLIRRHDGLRGPRGRAEGAAGRHEHRPAVTISKAAARGQYMDELSRSISPRVVPDP